MEESAIVTYVAVMRTFLYYIFFARGGQVQEGFWLGVYGGFRRFWQSIRQIFRIGY